MTVNGRWKQIPFDQVKHGETPLISMQSVDLIISLKPWKVQNSPMKIKNKNLARALLFFLWRKLVKQNTHLSCFLSSHKGCISQPIGIVMWHTGYSGPHYVTSIAKWSNGADACIGLLSQQKQLTVMTCEEMTLALDSYY